MVTSSIVLLTLGILALLEGLFITIWTKRSQRAFKYLSKHPRYLRHLGIIETVIAVGLILVGLAVATV